VHEDIPVDGGVHNEPEALLLVKPLYCSSGHIRLLITSQSGWSPCSAAN